MPGCVNEKYPIDVLCLIEKKTDNNNSGGYIFIMSTSL